MSLTPRLVGLACLLAWPLSVVRAEGSSAVVGIGAKAPQPPNLPALIPPQPDLVAYAATHGLPLTGIDQTRRGAAGAPGDSVTALITLREGQALRQWLVRLELALPTDKERKANSVPESGVNVNGHDYRFSGGDPLALDIRIAGPFAPGKKPPTEERKARTLVPPNFLALGLDEACRVLVGVLHPPPKDGEAPAPAAAPASPPALSAQEERTVGGMFPALVTFFNAAQTTPGIREIMWTVLDLPSAWSLVKHGGRIVPGFTFGDNISAVEPAAWAMPDRGLFYLGLDLALNEQPALRVSFVVTSPAPPLLNTAGIVGLVAQSPTKKDKRMDLQVIAARRAAATTTNPSP
jgi:hypothetical protein